METRAAQMWLVLALSISCFGISSISIIMSVCVDCRLFCSWSRWPLTEAVLLTRLLLINDEVRPGHESRWLLLMARIIVDGRILKAVAA